jgi:2-methylisocitrate lyase-like PEP mutase family enzyme
MKKTTMLRKILAKPGLIVLPWVYDCLSARCAEDAGFTVLFMTGGGIRDTQLGMPANSPVTAPEVITIIKNIANSVNVPLIADADDGYGGALSAYRTTQEIIKAGAAGLFIEDRLPSTRDPFVGVHGVIPTAEYLGKMGAVVEARNKEDKDFVIVARIEALKSRGIEDMLARVKGCLELGVDIIYPLGIPAGDNVKETLKKHYKAIGVPDVPIWGTEPFEFTAKDFEEIGAKLCGVPASPIASVARLLTELYQSLRETGTHDAYFAGKSAREFLIGFKRTNKWNELAKKYVPPGSDQG